MDNRYTDNRFLLDAQKLIGLGMAGAALMSCRNALETLVKDLCRRCGLQYDSRETDLLDMIDSLFEANIISADIKDLLHRARMTSNKAAHADTNVTLSEAQETYGIIVECISRIDGSVSDDAVQQAYAKYNVPMPNPDYYSPNRRYYGKWAHCYDRESLMVIPEYAELEAKAMSGDVAAMLDIASGFLPNNIVWSSDRLVNMPSYIYKGQAFNQDKAYDFRYYYWIMNAANEAYWQMDTFQRKYMATAVWEAFSFWFAITLQPEYPCCVNGVNEHFDESSRRYVSEPVYCDQGRLRTSMFNASDITLRDHDLMGMYDNAISVAREIFGDMTSCDYVSAVYGEAGSNPLFKLRFLRYCGLAMANSCYIEVPAGRVTLKEEDAAEINRDYRMFSELQGGQIRYREVHAGDLFDWEIVKPYTIGSFCNEKYNLARYHEEKWKRKNSSGLGKLKGLFR